MATGRKDQNAKLFHSTHPDVVHNVKWEIYKIKNALM